MDIFSLGKEPIPWEAIWATALQTFVAYWFVILGLKLVGRRIFGELGPEELLLIVLVAESMSVSLVHEDAGFLGSLVSAAVLFISVATVERLRGLRKRLEGDPIILLKNGIADTHTMRQNLIDRQDLEQAARRYGVASPEAFQLMVLESDGQISGVLKPEYRWGHPGESTWKHPRPE